MASLGFLMLGAFMGWVIGFGMYQVRDWSHPGKLFSAVTGATVSGAVFIFIQYLIKTSNISVIAIFFYPVGLAYGALCNGLGYIIAHAYDVVGDGNNAVAVSHPALLRWGAVLALAIASALLLALFFWWYNQLLPP